MRRFFSYGPVDERVHFTVPRREMVDRCVDQLIGLPETGGHYFTIWAPRQTGKTWLMRKAKQRIEEQYGDQFIIGTMSMQGVILKDDEPEDAFLQDVPDLIRHTFHITLESPPACWKDFAGLFEKGVSLADQPILLFIDEFDSLPRHVIDRLVVLFRNMYLHRPNYLLHGLALIGVRAVLGVDTPRGSPFNVQRSLHIPNFTFEEVQDLYRQYEEESGQRVEPEVVEAVYRFTRGQPGLVCWFGELLTETYNPGPPQPIDMGVWEDVYRMALYREWNNTVLNLVKKARGPYLPQVMELFTRDAMPFALDAEWCSFLYMNGIIDVETALDEKGMKVEVCRFSSPFIQRRLYNALTEDLVGNRTPILALEPLDDLADVFEGEALNLPALLQRYRGYLQRLQAKGLNPWKEQPLRSDLRLTEAVGHFHLYAWLREALNGYGIVIPEFPTGNGKVDLRIRCDDRTGVIEVKSFTNMRELDNARQQAARYAASLGLKSVTIALFVPTKEEGVLEKLSGEKSIEGVQMCVAAIGWEMG